MAVICYSGLPGTGKTASSTYTAVKKYKQDNSTPVLLLRYIKEAGIKNVSLKGLKSRLQQYTVNLIYSNYPILLDPKTNTYSNAVKPSLMEMNFQFPKKSLIILDEMQRYFDSREFKTFPKQLGVFFQHHRHADIVDIILVTQHPRRLDNKMRDLCEIFRKYRIFIKIPFIPVIFTSYTNYYEFDDYGRYNKLKKELRTYEYDNHIRFMLLNNVFTRYNSKYFSVIFEILELLKPQPFQSKDLSLTDIAAIGIDVEVSQDTPTPLPTPTTPLPTV